MLRFILSFFLVGAQLLAQNTIQNSGDIFIHGGNVGIFSDVVNDGTFYSSNGLVSFNNFISDVTVSGNYEVNLYDVEVAVEEGLNLETSLIIKNELSFIAGKIYTPKDNSLINLQLFNYDVYSGEDDKTHVEGYVSSVNNGTFIFPIGDGNELRPMIVPNPDGNTNYTGAYFKEDPNFPSHFNAFYNTDSKQKLLEEINENEFWALEGDTETSVILTWNESSNVSELSSSINDLRVVGWKKSLNKWVDLGQEEVSGDLQNGQIKSSMFIPDEYAIITIGSDFREVLGTITYFNHNFGFSPNGDGVHDTFKIEGIELRPNNTIKIFNRYGSLVYEKHNYDNSWDGYADNHKSLNTDYGLPVGTYFYILKFHDDGTGWSGFVYLNR